MMRTIAAAFLLTALGLSGALRAEPQAPPSRPLRIGVVDLTRVFDEYQASEDLMAQLEDVLSETQTQLQRLQREIAALRQSAQEYAMGTPEREAKEQELEGKVMTARILSSELQSSEESLRSKMLMSVYRDTERAIGAYAEEHAIDLVLKEQSLPEYDSERLDRTRPLTLVHEMSRRNVLFQRPEFDITDSIVERMNEAYREQKEQ